MARKAKATATSTDYKEPAWRKAKSARAYVEALLDNGASGLAADLETFVGLSFAEQENPDEQQYEQRRSILIDKALVRGVERARTIHDQITYEKDQQKKARKYLRTVKAMKKWVEEDFNNPQFRLVYQEIVNSKDPFERFRVDASLAIEPGLAWADPKNRINVDAIRDIEDRLNYRIAVAKNRFYLAWGTRELHLTATQEERDNDAVRFGIGEMAFWMMHWISESMEPTSRQLAYLTELAIELFRLPTDLKSSLVKHALATTVRIFHDRGEGGEWFGYY
jgi:hypothetical protein